MPCLLSQNSCILLRNFLEFSICQFLVFAQFWQGLLFHNSAVRVRALPPPFVLREIEAPDIGEMCSREGSALRFQMRTTFQSLWALVAPQLLAASHMKTAKSTNTSFQGKVRPHLKTGKYAKPVKNKTHIHNKRNGSCSLPYPC